MTLRDKIIIKVARVLARRFGAVDVADRVGQKAFKRVQRAERITLPHVVIGRHSYGISNKTVVLATAAAPVKVGSFCSVAEGVLIFGQADHPLQLASTYPFRTMLTRRFAKPANPENHNHDAVTKGRVEIGHDVWLGAGAIVLSGSKIGTGAVVGAGAVVAGIVPPYGIVVGNPARLIRKRFSNELIERLLQSQWWDLPDAEIFALDEAFYSPDTDQFLRLVAEAWARCNKVRGFGA